MSRIQSSDPKGVHKPPPPPENVLGLNLLQFPTYIPPRRDFQEPAGPEEEEEEFDSDAIPEHLPYNGNDPVLDSTTREYAAEFDPACNLNLGAESPGSILRPITPLTPGFSSSSIRGEEVDEWSTSALGKSMNTNVPARDRLWRSSSFNKRLNRGGKKQVVDDGDCGICFEIAVSPIKTPCCDKTFCKDHLIEWLHGSSSDGRCPSCKTIFAAFSSYTPSQSYPPTPKTPGTPPADQGFIPMATTSPSWTRYLPIPMSMAPSAARISRPVTPSPLSTTSSSADLYSSSSSSISSQVSTASTTTTVTRSLKEKGKAKEESLEGVALAATSPNSANGHPFSLAAWTNPEFMGGAVERLLSLVGLTLLFYVLLSSKSSSVGS